MSSTARAHTNIALIKYWGKRDADLILPYTDSLSLTLDEFYTTTTVNFDSQLKQDHLIIDGQVISPDKSAKVARFMDLVRQMSGQKAFAKIKSINHVPMSAGLASSASAFAALAAAASRAAGLNLTPTELSRLARRGSGSATRSVFGGLVQWHRGTDDESSYAEPIMEKVDFGLEMIAIMINRQQKKVSSRGGMQASVDTSPYFEIWPKVVEQDLKAIKIAIQEHNISKIGEITEANAMRMHALTLSAQPPFTYFEASTIKAINLINQLRQTGLNCYYTMDAGPNVKVIYDQKDRPQLLAALGQVFGQENLVVAQPGPGIEYLETIECED